LAFPNEAILVFDIVATFDGNAIEWRGGETETAD
jgi:hypothetical protein